MPDNSYRERDPMLRLLPEDPPDSFVSTTPDEQAWRGRVFLAVWAMGYPEPYAWWHALQTGKEQTDWLKDFVRTELDDEALTEAVTRRQSEPLDDRPDEVAAEAPPARVAAWHAASSPTSERRRAAGRLSAFGSARRAGSTRSTSQDQPLGIAT